MSRVAMLAAALATWGTSACVNGPAVLTQLMEARQLAAAMHVEFTKASESAGRAVMADTDDASIAAANEARRARKEVEQRVDTLRARLQTLGYQQDLLKLEGFVSRFDEYRRLDDEILPLAAENTNVRAQRLSFGAAREAADEFRTSLEGAIRGAASPNGCCAAAAALRARTALLEIQVLQAPHIAEADDAAMTRIEGQMAASEAAARKALDELGGLLGPAAASQLSATRAALDRFLAVHAEILTLSRRNSNVYSLALSLGRKRVVTAECEDQLRALEEALARHALGGTR